MSYRNSISIRLSPEMRQRLEEIASRSGIKASLLIRQAIADYCAHVQKTGKINFNLSLADDRTEALSTLASVTNKVAERRKKSGGK